MIHHDINASQCCAPQQQQMAELGCTVSSSNNTATLLVIATSFDQ